MGSIIFGSLDNAYATTWDLLGLYITVKSYSRNNNNHLIILFETYGLLTKYTNAICVMDRLQRSGELQNKTSFIDPSTGVDLLKGCSLDYLLL